MKSLFPFSRDGRQTLIYLVFAGAGPALTALVIWAMDRALLHKMFGLFRDLSWFVATSMMIVVIGLSMFVSIRAIKVGKDGLEASGQPDQEEQP